ncbi:DUF3995 domain-containing protein [Hyphomonas pacifica]|uniref:Uncharacterized protein n=1 Tax=Hyphomonas pacifica TaxID=1280941 RepID=A0A062U305_9PROT|nr:DUF3995 domain-containing protein [Hyphomonas pacifica]KCZ52652.1 hypothetical protein HY2_07880 [Hyphomonas pacifica]RAN34016.1 hypothetical protein HY3_11345 [Hyphomonas pacifica]RAN37103.1 hypothetical protein HY11_09960 [Hyphomonas pacifica]
MVPQIVSPVLVLVLTGLALLHLLWAMGSHFPCANEQALARAVVGRRGITRMPSAASCVFVALWLFAAAFWAAALGGYVSLPVHERLAKWLLALGGFAAGMVFMGRGIIGILPAFERALPELPFLKLNRRIYSPLSFLVGVGFILLVLVLPNWGWRLGFAG